MIYALALLALWLMSGLCVGTAVALVHHANGGHWADLVNLAALLLALTGAQLQLGNAARNTLVHFAKDAQRVEFFTRMAP